MPPQNEIFYGRFDASTHLDRDQTADLWRLAYEASYRDQPGLSHQARQRRIAQLLAARQDPNRVEAGPIWSRRQKASNRVGVLAVNGSFRAIAHIEVDDVVMSERQWPFNVMDFRTALSDEGATEERAALLCRLLVGDEMWEAMDAAGEKMNPLQVMMHIALASRDKRQIVIADPRPNDFELISELAQLGFAREIALPTFARSPAGSGQVRWVGPTVETALARLQAREGSEEILDQAYAQLQNR